MTIEVLTLGFYENNPGEFWCDGDEQVVDTLEVKGDGFPFALSDREKLAGKALRLLGQRWDRRSCHMQINGCHEEIVVWKYSREYKGEIPACALRIVKAAQ